MSLLKGTAWVVGLSVIVGSAFPDQLLFLGVFFLFFYYLYRRSSSACMFSRSWPQPTTTTKQRVGGYQLES